MKIDRRKKWIMTIVIFFIIVIVLSGICISNYIQETKNRNRNILEDVSANYLSTKGEREKGIEILHELLNKGRFLEDQDLIAINSKLSVMYFLNSNYQKGVEYSIDSIHLSKKRNENYIVGKNLLNLSNTFILLQGYDVAEDTVNYTLNLDIKDPIESRNIKEQSYIHLADIYSKTNRSNRALRYIEESMKYAEENSPNNKSRMIIREVISARAYFYKGDLNKSYELIKKLEVEFASNSSDKGFDYIIPFLGIKAKVELSLGKVKEGLMSTKLLFEACINENQQDAKVYYMDEILRILHEEHYDDHEELVQIYEHELLLEYKGLIREKNKESMFFIIDNYKSESKYLMVIDKKIVLYKTLLVVCFVVCVGFYILGRKISSIRTQGYIDALTEAYNRKKFDIEYARIGDYDNSALILIDIDFFKDINDNYGHEFGDTVLKCVSKIISDSLDKGENLFRYGGEEFCIICYNKTRNQVIKLAEEIRKDVESMSWREDYAINITISVGLAFRRDGEDVFSRADINLYNSKNSGRNKVTY